MPPQAADARPGSSDGAMPARRALRLGFCALFFGLELCAIAWGKLAPDHVLGFQMFNESSTLTIHLLREEERRHKRVLIPVPGGRWRAPDASGRWHEHAWGDRVRYQPLGTLEREVHARYGLDGQLFHLKAALKDVVAHLPDDARTLALVADVETKRNGVRGETLRLRAAKP